MGKPQEQKTAPVSEGVQSLMRGGAPAQPAPSKPAIPRWYLFAGDVLLVTLALITIYKSPGPLSWPREIFCAALVILAAALAIIALLPSGGGKPPGNS
ncbi:MAG TPA: hypothetical protein VGO59_19700 [Verrucomicrobiae bacterium]|jgi:hypothetical protein